MFAFTYPAKFTAGTDGRILVEFVDLPRVATDGKDVSEAFAEAMDALGADLSIRLSRREEIPVPSAAKRRQRLVPVPLWIAPKHATKAERIQAALALLGKQITVEVRDAA